MLRGLSVRLAALTVPALLAGIVVAGAATPSVGAPAAPAPMITLASPQDGGSYERGSRVAARYACSEDGLTAAIVSCTGTAAVRHPIDTRSAGIKSFTVVATDTSGASVTKTVHYDVWRYVNPLGRIAGLRAIRIDMGVDYAGAGPIVSIGAARVIAARYVPGPPNCWGRTCAPAPGGWVVYRLLDGPFAGRYVYAVENITPTVRAGQLLRAGQTIAILHPASPNLEIGWAAGRLAETLAYARHHACPPPDPGAWSSIEGRNFERFLVWLGAPSGFLQETPAQSMPRGWPAIPSRR